LAAEEFLASV